MEKVQRSFSLQCPAHPAHAIGMLNVDPNAKQIGYCYECIAENGENGSLFKTLKTVAGYLQNNSSFYEKCRQRAQNVGEPPAEFLEELSKKGERKGNFSQHIEQEKCKIERSFDEIRRTVEQIINEKEKECLNLFPPIHVTGRLLTCSKYGVCCKFRQFLENMGACMWDALPLTLFADPLHYQAQSTS